MSPSKNLTCLCVEDNDRLRASIIEWLTSRFPIKVMEARSGNQALEHLANHKIDFVVSDIEMPDGSGVDLGMALMVMRPRPTLIYFSSHSYLLEHARKYAMAAVLKPDFATLVKVVEIEVARLTAD
jgi:DNA-binding NtrC family response regulator